MHTHRICIYPKDIQLITGRSERYGRKLLCEVREYFGKQPHQFVTVEEFAEYAGLEVEAVRGFIR